MYINLETKDLDRATRLLTGLGKSELVQKALQRAMQRATQHLRSQTSKRIREEYAISKKDLRTSENIRISYTSDGMFARVYFSSEKIPLYRYTWTTPKMPTQDKSKYTAALLSGTAGEDTAVWRMFRPGVAAKAGQKLSEAPTQFKHAFIAKMSNGHIGIFERKPREKQDSDKQNKIWQLMGSSISQMVGNETVAENLTNDACKKFEERFDHEVNRLLGID